MAAQSPKKNGIRKGKQMYKCYACGKQYIGGFRFVPADIWKEYQEEKQTYLQLAKK